jgi:superoxide oxidase
MPIGGWLMLSAAGKSIPFFGLTLPALIEENKELAKTIKQVHATVGEIGYYVIALHAIAALFHHYILKDNTLLRMLPRKVR